MASDVNLDRNLLFAVIALQDDLIDQSQFADVCAGWAMQLARPLPDLLIERNWITEADRKDIERKIERKLKKNKGDVRATLGAAADIEAREVLEAIDNQRVRRSIHALPPARGHVLLETLVPPPSQRDSLRYTLTKLHAEGGLGKIWIAHDTDLNRDVALKEIKPSATPNPESWRRFLKEAQITGQLEHPNIVPVYELARRKEDNQPFYTMRFLRGQTFRDTIAEFHRRRAGKPADRLELQRQLLEPFAKICEAIGYAHSRGVIHRDLKPENVVLGAHGEVVVLDWGLGKVVGRPDDDEPKVREPRISVTTDAETSATIGQAGTPGYMAPEQVDADNALIDTRTDVYGLGAILFEILTARPPATGTTLGEVYGKIRTGNFPKPREIDPTAPRALEAVCNKAMAIDRNNRYRRVEDFSEDVRRWIVDEPVSVYRDPFTVRSLRWIRRHRTLATSLASALLLTVIGLSIGVVLIGQARARTETQRKIADEQRELASENAARAIANLRLAQDAADGLLGEVGDVDLADIPQMEPVRKRLLEKARVSYQHFAIEAGADPRIRWGAARAQVRLGAIEALLEDYPGSEKSLQRAAAELDKLAKEDPSNIDYRRDLARAYFVLGVLYKDANRFREGETQLRESIRLREEIAKLGDASSEDTEHLASSRYQLGALLARSGSKGPEAIAAYNAAISEQEQLAEQHVDQPRHRTQLARNRNNLGILQKDLGKRDESEASFREALKLLAPLVDISVPLPAPRWQFARASNNLGNLLLARRTDEAEAHLRRAETLLRGLAAEFPDIPQYARELAAVEYNLGTVAAKTLHPDQALAAYKESARLLEELKARSPGVPVYRMKLAVSRAGIAEVLADTTPDEATGALKKALDEQLAVLAEYPGVLEYQQFVGRHYYLLAKQLLQTDPTQALAQAESAKKFHKEFLKASPDSVRDQSALYEDQIIIIKSRIAVGDVDAAVEAAEELPTIQPTSPTLYLLAAGFLVKCAATTPATRDGKLQPESIMARAVALLSKAVQNGVIRQKRTLEDKSLLPLHERDDFKKLLKSVDEPVHIG
jgi:serine/threonine protein kinase